MKKILLVLLIISLSINSSLEEEATLSTKVKSYITCLLSSKKNVEDISTIFETLFKENSLIGFASLLNPLNNIMQECFGMTVFDLLNIFKGFTSTPLFQTSPKTSLILKQVQNLDAPILLRKYLYDNIVQKDLITAKKECFVVTSQHPFEKYNYICDLL